eukprot:13044539-Heterocapsa_arctica.AAC.1
MMRLRSRKNTCEALLDMCRFGMKDKCNGLLVKKATRILTNCEPIAVLLRKKCTRDQVHQVLEGFNAEGKSRTKEAGQWPPRFCRAILKDFEKACLFYDEYDVECNEIIDPTVLMEELEAAVCVIT